MKPLRDANRDPGRRRYWWRFGRSNQELRSGTAGLARYIASSYVAKHRVFQFLDSRVAPDDKVVCIADDAGYILGVLSSRIHVEWALATGRASAGERIGVLRRAFEGAVSRAKLPADLHQHDLRHRRVTTWLAAGGDAVKVKEAMGHADLRTTMDYTHLVRDNLRSLVEEAPARTSGIGRGA